MKSIVMNRIAQYTASVVLCLFLVGCNHRSNCKENCECGNKNECKQDKEKECCMQEAVINNILTRVSVRQFTGEKISDEQVECLLRCAMAAPSAVNKQPWEFIVINDEALIKRLGEALPFSRCANNPAVAIIPCGNMQRTLEREPDYWIDDLSAATENILLAAHAMGLGAVWTGVHPGAERVKQVQEIVGLPEHIVPLCIIPVGVPAEQPEVKDKWNTERIHYNAF